VEPAYPVVPRLFFLYTLTILIWGSTWFATTFQLGCVSVEQSIAYRFFLASFMFFIPVFFQKKRAIYPFRQHLFFALQGFLMYFASYLCIYHAARYIPSGLNALSFSFVIVLNVIFVSLFFKKPLCVKLLFSTFLGVVGIGLIFLPEVLSFSLHRGHLTGMSLSLLGCVCSALANTLIERHRQLPILHTSAFSMLYGAIFCLLYALAKQEPLTFDISLPYIDSLVYLGVFGSVVAFGCYTIILNRLGADKGGYPFVMIPVVSLFISQVFEGMEWHSYTLGGMLFLFTGNLLALSGTTTYVSQTGTYPAKRLTP
jgi:drug/metabolite transporter (DMT)-like permease